MTGTICGSNFAIPWHEISPYGNGAKFGSGSEVRRRIRWSANLQGAMPGRGDLGAAPVAVNGRPGCVIREPRRPIALCATRNTNAGAQKRWLAFRNSDSGSRCSGFRRPDSGSRCKCGDRSPTLPPGATRQSSTACVRFCERSTLYRKTSPPGEWGFFSPRGIRAQGARDGSYYAYRY